MTHEEIAEIRRITLIKLQKERNGAVVDAVDSLVTKTLFSYGVSLPTIKSIISPYRGNHDIALEFFSSNIRELKLAAIYCDAPEKVTIEQVKEWSTSLSTLELFENITFALLSRTNITDEIIKYWSTRTEPLFKKGIELLKMHHSRKNSFSA